MFVYDDKAKAKMAKRAEAMFARITNQTRIWDELQSRMTDPDALYFCGFEMGPDFVKVGDEVFTKYGDDGEVISISRQDEQIEIKAEDGEVITIRSDRISGLSYGGLDLVEVSGLGYKYEDFGWEY